MEKSGHFFIFLVLLLFKTITRLNEKLSFQHFLNGDFFFQINKDFLLFRLVYFYDFLYFLVKQHWTLSESLYFCPRRTPSDYYQQNCTEFLQSILKKTIQNYLFLLANFYNWRSCRTIIATFHVVTKQRFWLFFWFRVVDNHFLFIFWFSFAYLQCPSHFPGFCFPKSSYLPIYQNFLTAWLEWSLCCPSKHLWFPI